MKENIIILAIGLSGSSVLARLVSGAGYWVGEDTIKKTDYDTFENAELVRLNKKLLDITGIGESYGIDYRLDFADKMKQLYGNIDDTEFRAFAARCDSAQPWLWKDPRLSITMHFWKHLLDLKRIKFIVNDRDPMQAWISWTIRRQIQTFSYSKRYSDLVVGSIMSFLNEQGLEHINVRYEDLVCKPETTIAIINQSLGSCLTLEDMANAYQGKLRRKTHGIANFAKANLIYLKNYNQRYA
jgi:hypothetical protein